MNDQTGAFAMSETTPVADGAPPPKITAEHVNVFYGSKQAIVDLSIDIPERASVLIGRCGGEWRTAW